MKWLEHRWEREVVRRGQILDAFGRQSRHEFLTDQMGE